MSKKLSLIIIFLLLFKGIEAQEKKWNVELNYTIVPEEGFGGESDYIDLGLKYRFLGTEFLDFGIGFNAGYSKLNFGEPFDGDRKSLLFQPRLFSEIKIPGLEKLKPSVGIGYSLINDNTDLFFDGEDNSANETNGGLNFNLGVSYEIFTSFFIQAQYDFINLRVKDEVEVNNELVNVDFTEKLNNIRLGLGFRF